VRIFRCEDTPAMLKEFERYGGNLFQPGDDTKIP
jgi:hypothetical protein